MDLVLLKSIDLSQFLLVKDEVKLSILKMPTLPLLSRWSCSENIIFYYFSELHLLQYFA